MDKTDLASLISASRNAAAASIAGGIIAARGKPITLEEALQIQSDVYFALYPQPGQGRYEKWAQNRAENLKKLYD